MSDVSASISLCRTSSVSDGRGVERRVCLSTITIVASVVATRRPSLKMPWASVNELRPTRTTPVPISTVPGQKSSAAEIDQQARDHEAPALAHERPFRIVHEGDPADFGKRGEDRVVDMALPVEIRKADIGGGPARVVLQHALGLQVIHRASLR